LVEQSSVYKYITAELAHAAQAETYALEYRITPDHHHPAALDDAYKGYLALLEKGISPKDIFVAGDSAGGGLTLALLMKLRDEDKPLPRAAIVLSPWADLTHSGESMITRADLDPIITKGAAVFMASLVLKGQSAKDPLISPLFGNYDGLPPLMILVGGREVLFDDSVRVSDKAKKAGLM